MTERHIAMRWNAEDGGVITTPPCPRCGERGEVPCEFPQQYYYWLDGMFVQDAFPNMTIDQREQLISGYHPDCWNQMVAEWGCDDDTL